MIAWIKSWFEDDDKEFISGTIDDGRRKQIISRMQTKRSIAFLFIILLLIIWTVERILSGSDFTPFIAMLFYVNYFIIDTKIKLFQLFMINKGK